MRNVNLKTVLWNLFTSFEFFEETARECERIMNWFDILMVAQGVTNFGRNNQICDTFEKRASDFRRGAALARPRLGIR